MKVSIITVVYNNADTIEESVKSVLSQDYKNLEYVVIDGGSDDGTLTILQKYRDCVDVFVSEPDDGLYDAINKGIRNATGDIVGLLHSDDVFFSDDVVKKVVCAFHNDTSVMGVYGNIKYFSKNKNDVKRTWIADSVYDGYFDDGNVFPHTSFFVRKKVHEEIGYYHTDFRIGADYEFLLRMIKVHGYKVKYINKTIVYMRLGGESTKNILSVFTSFSEVRRAWKINHLTPPLSFYFKRYFKKFRQLF